jgi:hypothetical protein
MMTTSNSRRGRFAAVAYVALVAISGGMAPRDDRPSATIKLLRVCKDIVLVPGANKDRKGLMAEKRKWENGKILRVKFLDGGPGVQAKVRQHARAWSDDANITFLFVAPNDEAEIRISFLADPGSSWSAVGTDALKFAPGEPTMNFGWLDENSDHATVALVVLHEFGHALGLLHEHQHPQGKIHWNEPNVINYCKTYWGWNEDQVRDQIFDVYYAKDAIIGDFDADSIMMYPVPAGWTTDGFTVGTNRKLSDGDKRFIRQQYPRE